MLRLRRIRRRKNGDAAAAAESCGAKIRVAADSTLPSASVVRNSDVNQNVAPTQQLVCMDRCGHAFNLLIVF